MFEDIHDDILASIFQFLDYFYVTKISTVNHHWRAIAYEHVKTFEYNINNRHTVGTTSSITTQHKQRMSITCNRFFYYDFKLMINHLLVHCHRLEKVTLSSCDWVTPSILLQIGQAETIRTISLCHSLVTSDDPSDTDAFYHGIAHILTPHVESLSLDDIQNRFNTTVIIDNVHRLGNLTQLNLSGCYTVDDECVASLVACKKMKSLLLSRCFKVTDNALCTIIPTMTQLETLCVDKCTLLTSEILVCLSTVKNTPLRKLDVSYCVLMENFSSLSKLVNLKDLKCSNTKFSTQGMRSLPHSITSLYVISCTEVDDEAASLLSALPNLRTVNLSHCKSIVDTSTIQNNRLESLILSSCRQVPDHVLLSTLNTNNWSSLKTLVLPCTTMNDQILVELSLPTCSITCLEHFNISYPINEELITDSGMVPFLQRHTGIKRLLLGGVTNITTETLRAIATNLHYITTLNLSENANLMTEELSTNSTEYVIPSLRILGLCQSNVTDSILVKWIGKLHNLNSIDLSYCNRITDQGVKIFGPMLPHLMEIDLSSNYNVASLSTNRTFPSRVFIVEPYPHDKVFGSESHGGGRNI